MKRIILFSLIISAMLTAIALAQITGSFNGYYGPATTGSYLLGANGSYVLNTTGGKIILNP